MLAFRVLFFTTSVFWLVDADEYRRYRDIDVKLVNNNDETFESKMREVIEASERSLGEKIVDAIPKIAGSFSDKLNPLAEVFLLVKELISIDNDVINSLVKAIPIEIERSNIRQDIVNMGARMKTISFNIDHLKESNDVEVAVRKSIVHDMHNALLDMVNTIDHPGSDFKKHPLLAVPLLFSLASFVAVYNRIETTFNPQLANRSIVGCKIQRLLDEYKPIVTIDRLTKIKIVSTFIPHPPGYYGDSKCYVISILLRLI